MSLFTAPRFLSRILWLDAASCLATGALQLAITPTLASWTGLPAPLLTGTGVFLVVYALLAAWMARQDPTPRGLTGLVVVGNFAWALGCIALMLSQALPLTGLGLAWLGLQAVVVVVLAELQWTGLRRTRPGRGQPQPA
ncbi:hypothetical protein CCO03_05195 [Comamonas serinivorans]|uniref:Integral membrane protein n=1 Tax=Comamonas serinivorans TaxID=1082851 RepID=A0A1Y0EL28_9BURK|nr:hypothetical protein [Comamonas serinivorans]ARU04151.1 hypothetical protein CCO03_05195 [Comamonas serinivorans]